jgi:site-specific recombinase XerD
VCEHAGLEINISPQDLRSSLILHMLENDVDMNVIKETLGLSSYFMFFNYLHLLDKSKMQKYRKILRHVHNDYK